VTQTQPDDPGVEDDEVAAKPIGGFMVYTPSRREKFWRGLGFRWRCAPPPEGWSDYSESSLLRIGIRFGFADRLRLLLTGHVRLRVDVYHEYPIGRYVASTDFGIAYPGERQ
jgi:hypothetical protein